MVPILDGNLEVCSHVRINLCMLIDMFKAFDKIESSLKSHFLNPKRPYFLHAYAIYFKLPSYISNIFSNQEIHVTYIKHFLIRILKLNCTFCPGSNDPT